MVTKLTIRFSLNWRGGGVLDKSKYLDPKKKKGILVTVPVMQILNLLPKNMQEAKSPSPSPGSDTPVLFLAVMYHDHLVNNKSKYFNISLYLNIELFV